MPSLKDLLPEWPAIDPSRPCVVGLKSGIDHPLAAVLLVATPFGLVAVREYRQRLRALAAHVSALQRELVQGLTPIWAASKHEPELQTEFGQHGVNVALVPADDLAGIQRVQSWLFAKQLFFAPTVPLLIEDMQAYRFAPNELRTGEKRQVERAFKQADELPTALRNGLLLWPALPKVADPATALRNLTLLDPKTRADIERMREFETMDTRRDVQAGDLDYPFGEMFGGKSAVEFDVP